MQMYKSNNYDHRKECVDTVSSLICYWARKINIFVFFLNLRDLRSFNLSV